MNWVRVAVSITTDPAVFRIAAACGVKHAEAIGLVVSVFTALPSAAPTGDIRDVPDALLEAWARWERKRGVFAQAFRAELCTAEGLVRSWEKHNGAALRDAEVSRERARTWRAAKKAERDAAKAANDTVRRSRTRTNGVRERERERVPYSDANEVRTPLRDETRRDETNYKNQEQFLDAAAAASGTGWPANWPEHLHAFLRDRCGVLIPHGQIGRLARLAVAQYPPAQVEAALLDYDAHRTSRKAPFNLADVCQAIPGLVQLQAHPIAEGSPRMRYLEGGALL